MIKVYINNVDMTRFYKPKSLKIDMDSSHYKTCSLTLYNITINEGVPEEGKILRVDLIKDDSTPVMLFEGNIDSKPSIKQLSPDSDKLEVQVSSNGYRYIPYRRTVTEIFEVPAGEEYITAKQIIEYLITTTNYLNAEGVQYVDIGVLEGKRYEDTQEFICMSIGDIFDKLAQDSNANWYINHLKVLYFVEEYYSFDGQSDYDIDSNNQILIDFRNPEVTTSLQNYANKVFFKGDLEDVDMREVSVFAQDDDEIAHMSSLDGGSGVYGCSVDNSSITTQVQAQAYCQRILDKRKAKPKTLRFDTFNVLDYQVGQKQVVNLPSLGIVKPDNNMRNYIVERISVTDFDGKRLTKNLELRQLFPNGIGGYTWQKSAQGVAFFKKLTQRAKSQQTETKNMLKNHVYVDNLRGSVLSTQNLTGNGDYIQLERQYMTFWDSTTGTIKMAMGFVNDNTGTKIPGIVLGAGDEQGQQRGYITKGTNGLDIFYITPTGGVARLRLGDDGKVYINESEVAAFSASNQIPSTYIQEASYWNQALAGMTYDDNTKSYYVGSSKLYDGAVTNGKINDGAVTNGKVQSISADKINGGTIQGVVFQTAYDSTTWGTRLKIDNYGSNITFNYKPSGGTEEARGSIEFSTTQMSIKPKGAATLSIGDTASGGATHTTYPKGEWNFTYCTPSNFPSYTKSESNSNFAAYSHSHSGYASYSHTHSEYASASHGHGNSYIKDRSDLGIGLYYWGDSNGRNIDVYIGDTKKGTIWLDTWS